MSTVGKVVEKLSYTEVWLQVKNSMQRIKAVLTERMLQEEDPEVRKAMKYIIDARSSK